MPTSGSRSIGQVLASLKPDFPEISISKIRFLETAGLLTPERAPSGYRRYSASDVERLRYVLSVQRNHYLPLKVIREHLDLMDRGRTPPAVDALRPVAAADAPTGSGAAPAEPETTAAPPVDAPSPAASAGEPAGGAPAAAPPAPPRLPLRLSREDLLEASGLTEAALADLERTQIVTPKRGSSHYGREALTLAIAAKRMGEYGIDGRHLRAFKLSADREVGLVEQAIAPHVRRAGGNKDVSGEVTQLVISFHAALIRTAMER